MSSLNSTSLVLSAQPLTMSSQEIAELVGKRHDNVKRTIETIVGQGVIQLPQIEEVPNHLGQRVSVYSLCKRDTYVVVAQLSPEFTGRLVDRWQELESRQPDALATLPPEQRALVALMVEQAEHKQRLAEHDDRIKRVEAKQAAFEEGSKYFTVLGFFVYRALPPLSLVETAQFGKQATKLSKERGVLVDKVRDPRFGLVGAYHESVLEAVLANWMES